MGFWACKAGASSSGDGPSAMHGMRKAALLAGVAMIAFGLGAPLQAQEADEQAQSQEPAETASETRTTVLDKLTVVSRTDESAIDTMASVSHVGQEQLERRMASTP